MFGKKKHSAPLKNQPRSQEEVKEPKRGFSMPKLKFAKKKRSAKSAKSRFRITRAIMNVLDGSFLSQDWVIRLAPLIGFAFVLTIGAIANNYIAQRKAREIDRVKREIKDLRDEYISTKSQLMYSTKMSEVARKLQGRGIKEPVKPAFKLIISKKGGEE